MQSVKEFQAKPNELKNKTILITGAGDGIGATAAKTFAQFGATVILLGRTIRKLESVYDEIIQLNHPQPAIYPLDLQGSKAEDYHTLAQIIEKEFGSLHGLLHNAAILGTNTPITQYNPQLWNQVMQINCNAAFMLSQACLPLLRNADSASIIFTSSNVGQKGKAYWGAYAASKAATDNLMQTLADELSENTRVRVNSLNPGSVRTTLRASAFPGENPAELPSPAEIMPVYLYLMSHHSIGINGQTLNAQ